METETDIEAPVDTTADHWYDRIGIRTLEAINAERAAQDAKWGDQSNNADHVWSDVLGEEMGEVCKARLHNEFGGDCAGTLRKELIQVAAVACAWIDAIDRRGENHHG